MYLCAPLAGSGVKFLRNREKSKEEGKRLKLFLQKVKKDLVRKKRCFTFALPIGKMVAGKVLKSGVDKGFEGGEAKSKEAKKNFKKLLVKRKRGFTFATPIEKRLSS